MLRPWVVRESLVSTDCDDDEKNENALIRRQEYVKNARYHGKEIGTGV